MLPEAAPVPGSRNSKGFSLDQLGARNSQTKVDALKMRSCDPYNDDDLDKSRALRCNDGSNTVGMQRGVWVIGGPSLDLDLSERVCARLATDMCLNLVTPKTVLQQAVDDATAFQKQEQGVADANEALIAEADTNDEGENDMAASLATMPSLSAKGLSLLSGASVAQKDVDTLLKAALITAAAPV